LAFRVSIFTVPWEFTPMFKLRRRLIFVGFLALPIALISGRAVSAADIFGAISYSTPDGADGYSYNYNSQAEAEARALAECRGYGGINCQILVWFKNGCGAMATAPSGAYGSGWGTTTGLAESEALKTCQKSGDRCQIKRWVCTEH
jgi:Domain of unknown function (DUF4189)